MDTWSEEIAKQQNALTDRQNLLEAETSQLQNQVIVYLRGQLQDLKTSNEKSIGRQVKKICKDLSARQLGNQESVDKLNKIFQELKDESNVKWLEMEDKVKSMAIATPSVLCPSEWLDARVTQKLLEWKKKDEKKRRQAMRKRALADSAAGIPLPSSHGGYSEASDDSEDSLEDLYHHPSPQNANPPPPKGPTNRPWIALPPSEPSDSEFSSSSFSSPS